MLQGSDSQNPVRSYLGKAIQHGQNFRVTHVCRKGSTKQHRPRIHIYILLDTIRLGVLVYMISRFYLFFVPLMLSSSAAVSCSITASMRCRLRRSVQARPGSQCLGGEINHSSRDTVFIRVSGPFRKGYAI